MYFSKTASPSSVNDFYRNNGFVVVRSLLDDDKIEALLNSFKTQVVPSTQKLYRQNSNRYEKNQFNAAGHVTQSFFDVLGYRDFPEFKTSTLSLLFDDALLTALQDVTRFEKFNLMQTAMFDANTETPAHQDWWYADSIPSGNMVGAWIALEDIAEEAGRFYVLSGSHKVVLHEAGMRHSTWRDRLDDYVLANRDLIVAPALKKGDVIFFNVGVIHGSLPTEDASLSRKSMVGHYIPAHMTYGSLFGPKPWVTYQTYQAVHQYHIHKAQYSLKANLITWLRARVYDSPFLMRQLRRFQQKSMADY